MLLVHQAGAVKVGEVIRYTVTYTPSSDRILPSPSHLHIKIKNTSAIPLRAAYLHGPYTLHVSAHPSTYNPNKKFESAREDGVPAFEPNLKAGGHWHSRLVIPERIRESGVKANAKWNTDGSPKSVTWIVEIASQILFSNTASVHYELLIGRDRRSLDLGFAAIASKGQGEPAQVQDSRREETQSPGRHSQPKGVYSRAIGLVIEDTATLWNKPALPMWEIEKEGQAAGQSESVKTGQPLGTDDDSLKSKLKKRKLHLVILTHGLHSNVGADLLYMKESIDETARQVHETAKERRLDARRRRQKQKRNSKDPAETEEDGEDLEEEEESDDEQIIVRGFTRNAVRTERGIQYLGKRLAKFVLTMTYPDQPFLPTSRSIAKSFGQSFSSATNKLPIPGKPVHSGSSIQNIPPQRNDFAYTYTSISFIGHSLGGLIQTYAIAYIQKHSPEFFSLIKPVNFVALATPFLGLSNENPLYVKFALDFGLVGRTGQDLGLTWRAPNVARTGWSAVISGFGSNGNQEQPKEEDPRAKPLLRILPSGPAHQVLKKFRNRTVYSNVVNDGIVPLRTSCLLFLDWRGLGKVENARRENGLIGTMAAFGWAELTGANSKSHRPSTARSEDDEETQDDSKGSGRSQKNDQRRRVSGQMSTRQGTANERDMEEPQDHQFLSGAKPEQESHRDPETVPNVPSVGEDVRDNTWKAYTLPNNPLTDFINLFRPSPAKSQSTDSQKISKKAAKTYRRAQTIKQEREERREAGDSSTDEHQTKEAASEKKPGAARGGSYLEDPNATPPPKTSIFDAAGDILNPPLPPESWLIDPSKRDRTIFHDRIYHPEDIPAPSPKRPKLPRSISSNGSLRSNARSQSTGDVPAEGAGMKVEEKIARAYHNDMPWRKVLVRLEPDAHNNMIVRRMFANAYGWDVVKHLCDTHFGDTFAATTRDEFQGHEDRANPLNVPGTTTGNQVGNQGSVIKRRSTSELREETDKVADLETASEARGSLTSSIVNPTLRSSRSQDSAVWNDSILDDEDGDDGEDTDEEATSAFETFQRFWTRSPKPEGVKQSDNSTGVHDPKLAIRTQQIETEKDKKGSSEAEIADQLTLSPEQTSPRREGGITKPEPAIQSTFDVNSVQSLSAEEARPSELGHNRTEMKNPSNLGLEKPVEAHIGAAAISPEMARPKSKGNSYTQQVAEASRSSNDTKRS